MAQSTKKLVQELQSCFGVHREFADHLIPLLEHLAAQDPSAEEWHRVLSGLAAAYRASATRPEARLPIDDVSPLVGQLHTELRKVDESLKVLAAFLERIRQQIDAPRRPYLLH